MDLNRSIKSFYLLTQQQPLVLVVDNNPDNLELTTEIVKWCGFSVKTATNGQSALQMVKKHQPALVLIKLMLPELSGIEIIEYLRRKANSVPIIAVTSLPGDMFKEQALLAGCNEYIEKPLIFEELEEAITRYL